MIEYLNTSCVMITLIEYLLDLKDGSLNCYLGKVTRKSTTKMTCNNLNHVVVGLIPLN